MNARPLISMRGVKKAFEGQPVLRGVDLDVFEGQTFVLLGGSGSGKTVLLKHLEGLLRPDEGSVMVDGHELSAGDPAQLDAVRREIGIQFQANALFDSLSVADNVAFPLRELQHLKEPEVKARVDDLLALLGLSEAAALFPSDLPTAFRIADQVGLLSEGKVIEVGGARGVPGLPAPRGAGLPQRLARARGERARVMVERGDGFPADPLRVHAVSAGQEDRRRGGRG